MSGVLQSNSQILFNMYVSPSDTTCCTHDDMSSSQMAKFNTKENVHKEKKVQQKSSFTNGEVAAEPVDAIASFFSIKISAKELKTYINMSHMEQ